MAGPSISDTIVDFAAPLLRQLEDPPNVDALKKAFDLAISVWNAHVMACAQWGRPEQLAELARLVSISASPSMSSAFALLSSQRKQRFSCDVRLVSDWEVVIDELGQARFDCTAQCPSEPSVQTLSAARRE
jgi:hypothetical protein